MSEKPRDPVIEATEPKRDDVELIEKMETGGITTPEQFDKELSQYDLDANTAHLIRSQKTLEAKRHFLERALAKKKTVETATEVPEQDGSKKQDTEDFDLNVNSLRELKEQLQDVESLVLADGGIANGPEVVRMIEHAQIGAEDLEQSNLPDAIKQYVKKEMDAHTARRDAEAAKYVQDKGGAIEDSPFELDEEEPEKPQINPETGLYYSPFELVEDEEGQDEPEKDPKTGLYKSPFELVEDDEEKSAPEKDPKTGLYKSPFELVEDEEGVIADEPVSVKVTSEKTAGEGEVPVNTVESGPETELDGIKTFAELRMYLARVDEIRLDKKTFIPTDTIIGMIDQVEKGEVNPRDVFATPEIKAKIMELAEQNPNTFANNFEEDVQTPDSVEDTQEVEVSEVSPVEDVEEVEEVEDVLEDEVADQVQENEIPVTTVEEDTHFQPLTAATLEAMIGKDAMTPAETAEHVEAFEQGITNAQSFDDLYKTLRGVDYIESTVGWYTSQQLVDIVEMVRKGEQLPFVITRNTGLREKVEQLIAQGAARDKKTPPPLPKRTPPPLPSSPEAAQQTFNPEAVEKTFEEAKAPFVAAEKRYFQLYKQHLEKKASEGIMDRLMSKFGAPGVFDAMPDELVAARAELLATQRVYAKALLDREVAYLNEDARDEVMFADLDHVARRRVTELLKADPRYNPNFVFKLDSIVPEKIVTRLIRERLITAEQATAFRAQGAHPDAIEEERLNIWSTMHTSLRDRQIDLQIQSSSSKLKKGFNLLMGKMVQRRTKFGHPYVPTEEQLEQFFSLNNQNVADVEKIGPEMFEYPDHYEQFVEFQNQFPDIADKVELVVDHRLSDREFEQAVVGLMNATEEHNVDKKRTIMKTMMFDLPIWSRGVQQLRFSVFDNGRVELSVSYERN